MIYFGMTAPHWREEFAGNICTQVFMHYVRSRGQYATFYFNKDRKVVTDSSKIAFNHYPDIEPANVIIDDSLINHRRRIISTSIYRFMIIY